VKRGTSLQAKERVGERGFTDGDLAMPGYGTSNGQEAAVRLIKGIGV